MRHILFAIIFPGLIFFTGGFSGKEFLSAAPLSLYPAKPETLFVKDSFWNTSLPKDPEIDPRSREMVNTLVYQFDVAAHEDDEDGFLLTRKEWTVPVYFADATTPRKDVTLTVDWAPMKNMVLKQVPLPAHAREDPALGDGGEVFNRGETWGDGEMVLIDLKEKKLYEFWQAGQVDDKGRRVFSDEKRKGARWVASWGIVLPLDGSGIAACGMSARGAGSSLVAGMIWPGELKKGAIPHKLAFSFAFNNKWGPVGPFTENDGWITPGELREETGRSDIYPLPEGAVVQLDPSIDLETLRVTDPLTGKKRPLKPFEKTIARAMQVYGMVNVDNSGDIEMELISELSFRPFGRNPYSGLVSGGEEGYVALPRELVAHTRVLETGPVRKELGGLTREQWSHYTCDGKPCQPAPEWICRP